MSICTQHTTARQPIIRRSSQNSTHPVHAAGPNTLVGLATVAEGVSRSDLVARLVPAYVDLLQQLKVPTPLPPSLPPRPSRPLLTTQSHYVLPSLLCS